MLLHYIAFRDAFITPFRNRTLLKMPRLHESAHLLNIARNQKLPAIRSTTRNQGPYSRICFTMPGYAQVYRLHLEYFRRNIS